MASSGSDSPPPRPKPEGPFTRDCLPSGTTQRPWRRRGYPELIVVPMTAVTIVQLPVLNGRIRLTATSSKRPYTAFIVLDRQLPFRDSPQVAGLRASPFGKENAATVPVVLHAWPGYRPRGEDGTLDRGQGRVVRHLPESEASRRPQSATGQCRLCMSLVPPRIERQPQRMWCVLYVRDTSRHARVRDTGSGGPTRSAMTVSRRRKASCASPAFGRWHCTSCLAVAIARRGGRARATSASVSAVCAAATPYLSSFGQPNPAG